MKQNNVNDTLKTIYERRATRKYKKTPVDRELIERVLEAGMMAPSAMNRQPWKFYVLTDPEVIHSFSKEISAVAFKDVLHAGVKEIVRTAAGLMHFSHVEKTAIYSRLQAPYTETVQLAVIIGYGDECPAAGERKIDNIIFIN